MRCTCSLKRRSPLSDRVYAGTRGRDGCRVHVLCSSGVDLLWPRPDTVSCADAWGRDGSAPRQLSWWLLYDVTRDEQLAEDWFVDLCAEIVAALPTEAFALPATDLMMWLSLSPPGSAIRE